MFLSIAIYTVASNKCQKIAEIQKEKKYDLLLCDVTAHGYIISEMTGIPFVLMDPFIVSVYDSQFWGELFGPTGRDEYVSNLVNQKMRECLPEWDWHKAEYAGKQSPGYNIVMSSELIYSSGGKNLPPAPERKFYVANRAFDYKFNPDLCRPMAEVAKDPRVFISFGTEMCFDYELIDGVIKYFSAGNASVIFTFGGNKQSYERYKDTVIPNPNFKLELVVNQKEILSQGIDIFFCHCGAGSAYESIYYGVPVICIPQSWDQPMNAEALVDMGCGVIYGDSPKETAYEKVEERVKTLLGRFDYHRQNVQDQQKKLMSGDNNEDVIDKLLVAFEKDPKAFGPVWKEFTQNAPAPKFVPRAGLGLNFLGLMVWLVFVLSMAFGVFRYIR